MVIRQVNRVVDQVIALQLRFRVLVQHWIQLFIQHQLLLRSQQVFQILILQADPLDPLLVSQLKFHQGIRPIDRLEAPLANLV